MSRSVFPLFILPLLGVMILSRGVLAQENLDPESATSDTFSTESLNVVNGRIDFISDEIRKLNQDVENLGQNNLSQNELLLKRIDDLVGEIESLRVSFSNLQEEVSRIKEQITDSSPQVSSLSAPSSDSDSNLSPEDLSPEALYNQAYESLTDKDFDTARAKMTSFLQLHPDHKLSDNAAYWIGETYFAEKQYEKALAQFSEALERYPEGNKAPDNLLKLSISLIRLDKKTEACVALEALIEQYQNAPKHIKERTRGEIKKLKCPS